MTCKELAQLLLKTPDAVVASTADSKTTCRPIATTRSQKLYGTDIEVLVLIRGIEVWDLEP